MGYSSYLCKHCDHAIVDASATDEGINGWMGHVVMMTENGSRMVEPEYGELVETVGNQGPCRVEAEPRCLLGIGVRRQVEFELERMDMEDETVNRAYAGIGFVKGKKKIRAEFEGDVIALSDIEDVDEQKRFFKLLTRDLRL